MKKIIVLFLLAAMFAVSAKPLERFETEFTKELKVVAFYPCGGCKGYFFRGQEPTFTLAVKNNTGADVKAEYLIIVKDWEGKTVSKLPAVVKNIAAGGMDVASVKVPAPEKLGFFVLDAQIKCNQKHAVSTQSSFIVTTPPPAKRDPFFGLDVNGIYIDMLEGYKLLGAGSIGVSMHRPFIKDPEKDVEKEFNGRKWQTLMKSDFTLVAHLSPTVYQNKRVIERRKKNLPGLCDEEIEHYRKFVGKLAALTRDRIRLWLIQQEYDAGFIHPEKTYGDGTAVISNFVIMARVGYQEIKKANPNANVAVLGMMGIDYYSTEPKFMLSKLILDDLKENFDMLCVDGYNGNWNGLVGEFPLPETGFRKFLIDTAKLSADYKRPGFVINAENGYAYDYFSPFDSEIAKCVAQYVARRLIINRSAPSPYCSWHMASTIGPIWRLNTKKADETKPLADLGTGWKVINNEFKDKYVVVPKMAGAAYATVAREFAFVKPDTEIVIGSNVYCYTFTRQDGGAVAALWSIDDPVKAIFELPSDAVLTDMMGNKSKLAKGKTELILTKSPLYLSLKGDVKPLADAIAKAQLPVLVPVLGEGCRTSAETAALFLRNCECSRNAVSIVMPDKTKIPVSLAPFESRSITVKVGADNGDSKAAIAMSDGRQFEMPLNLSFERVQRITSKPKFDGTGAWFKNLKTGSLVTPDHVWPKTAMIPEWGLFKLDGSDISARYALAYDESNLYLAVAVKDKRHLQRYSGKDLWKDDSLQVVISSRNLPTAKLRTKTEKSNFGKTEYNVSLALAETGTELYAHNNGKKAPGFIHWPAAVTRSSVETLYEIAVPWNEINLKPTSGSGLKFGFVVMDNNRTEDAAAKYHLAFSQGICGSQDPAELKTLIFE